MDVEEVGTSEAAELQGKTDGVPPPESGKKTTKSWGKLKTNVDSNKKTEIPALAAFVEREFSNIVKEPKRPQQFVKTKGSKGALGNNNNKGKAHSALRQSLSNVKVVERDTKPIREVFLDTLLQYFEENFKKKPSDNFTEEIFKDMADLAGIPFSDHCSDHFHSLVTLVGEASSSNTMNDDENIQPESKFEEGRPKSQTTVLQVAQFLSGLVGVREQGVADEHTNRVTHHQDSSLAKHAERVHEARMIAQRLCELQASKNLNQMSRTNSRARNAVYHEGGQVLTYNPELSTGSFGFMVICDWHVALYAIYVLGFTLAMTAVVLLLADHDESLLSEDGLCGTTFPAGNSYAPTVLFSFWAFFHTYILVTLYSRFWDLEYNILGTVYGRMHTISLWLRGARRHLVRTGMSRGEAFDAIEPWMRTEESLDEVDILINDAFRYLHAAWIAMWMNGRHLDGNEYEGYSKVLWTSQFGLDVLYNDERNLLLDESDPGFRQFTLLMWARESVEKCMQRLPVPMLTTVDIRRAFEDIRSNLSNAAFYLGGGADGSPLHWDWWTVGQLIQVAAHLCACLTHAWLLARIFECERNPWLFSVHVIEVVLVHFVFIVVRALEMSLWNPSGCSAGAINLLRYGYDARMQAAHTWYEAARPIERIGATLGERMQNASQPSK